MTDQIERKFPHDFSVDDILDAKTLAERLHCSVSWLHAARHRGLPALRVGRSLHFDGPATVAWILQNCQAETVKSE